MSRGPSIHITEHQRCLLIRGRRAGLLLRQAGMRPIYAGTVQAWVLDRDRLADVAAYLDYRNVSYSVMGSGDAA